MTTRNDSACFKTGHRVFGSIAEARATTHPAVRQFLDGLTEGPL